MLNLVCRGWIKKKRFKKALCANHRCAFRTQIQDVYGVERSSRGCTGRAGWLVRADTPSMTQFVPVLTMYGPVLPLYSHQAAYVGNTRSAFKVTGSGRWSTQSISSVTKNVHTAGLELLGALVVQGGRAAQPPGFSSVALIEKLAACRSQQRMFCPVCRPWIPWM